MHFDPGCRACPRLATFLAEGKRAHPGYYCAPVAPFGEARPRLLIVGLAPGFHGANATGRPFTGDYAGVLLYATLHAQGLASAPVSTSPDDGLVLHGCRITNAVKCVPPANKPTGDEIARCNAYLAAELASLESGTVLLALGAIAHGAVLRARGLKPARFVFKHGAVHALEPGLTLVDSYHCSRYNTQTRRLTTAMFESVVATAARIAWPEGHPGGAAA